MAEETVDKKTAFQIETIGSASSAVSLSSGRRLWAQSRHCGRRPTTSGLPLQTDIVRAGRHVSKVPDPDMAGRRRYAHQTITLRIVKRFTFVQPV